MKLEIEYNLQEPLPPEVLKVAYTIIANLQKHLKESKHLEPSHVSFAEHQIGVLQSIIDSNQIDKVSLAIHALGIVQQTDGTQTWNIYYCQVSPSTILVIDGLMIDEDVCKGSMPCSHLDFFSYRVPNGKLATLCLIGSGHALTPFFMFKPGQVRWPYMPKPSAFAGTLDKLAKNQISLATPAAPMSELADLEKLLLRL